MCGIVGFVGKEAAAPILLDGLERLEYRGYDSAGVCVIEDGALRVAKSKGRLKVLSDMIHGGADFHGTVGIGHTRWATHGEPSDLNSHPHVSEDGTIAVVHNGIIENYMEIKEFLLSKGVTFTSDTDTEVVAQLLEYYFDGTDWLGAVNQVLDKLDGSYAFGILCSTCPDRIIAARKDSPLVLGFGDGFSMLASDVTAMIRYTRDVCYMDDGDVAVVTADSIQMYDALMEPVEKPHTHVDWEISSAEKGGYAHFMFKEIMEEPEAVRRAIQPHIRGGEVQFENLHLDADFLRQMTHLYIVACGSSYHVGIVGKYYLERLLRRSVEVVLASEFRYCDPVVDEKSLVIVISQSGETLDSLYALREAKNRGARTLAIVNVVGSTIAKAADDVIYTWAGPEIAVATTKAYSTQLAVIDLLGLYMARALHSAPESVCTDILTELQRLPEKLEQILQHTDDIQRYAAQYFNHESVFFIGRNMDYALGLEGSLKLKEISYILSESYASGELKHGTISLVVEGTLVVALATYGPLFEKAMSNVVEVKSRGADVLGLTTESHRAAMEKVVDSLLVIPDTHDALLPNLGVVPLQLFAYYVALMRGCDIDKPRNLAKSVTVE